MCKINIKYILLSFIIMIILMPNVFACTTSDGCTNCVSGVAETECKKGLANTCASRCKNIQSASAQEECLRQCNGSTSSNGSTGGSVSGGTSFSGSSTGSYNNGASTGSTPNKKVNTSNITVTENPNVEDGEDLNCDSLFGTNTAFGKFIHDLYNIIKFAVPILLLALSIKDFGSGIISQNDNVVRTAMLTFSKRLIISILILVVPTILNFILKLLEIDTCFL